MRRLRQLRWLRTISDTRPRNGLNGPHSPNGPNGPKEIGLDRTYLAYFLFSPMIEGRKMPYKIENYTSEVNLKRISLKFSCASASA